MNQPRQCPNCGVSDFTEGARMGTLDYYPPRYVDGVNVNPDKNSEKQHLLCNGCNKRFSVEDNPNREDYKECKEL